MGKHFDVVKEAMRGYGLNFNEINDQVVTFELPGKRWTEGRYGLLCMEAGNLCWLSIISRPIVEFEDKKKSKALTLINDFNANLMCKFALTDEKTLLCSIETYFTSFSKGILITLLSRITETIDEVYPKIMELAWK